MIDLKQVLEDIEYQDRSRVIIINENNSKIYKMFCKDNNIPIINLSEKLSELVSCLDDEEREMESWDSLKNWMSGLEDHIIAFDNIDYFFSPEVGTLDINNFNYYSRNKKVIILFIHARKRNNLLIYSNESNPDYKEIDLSSNEGFVFGW
jgi:hypothetical protein